MTSPKYASLFEYGVTPELIYCDEGLYLPWELPDVMDGDMAAAGWRALQPLVRLGNNRMVLPMIKPEFQPLESD